MVQHLPLKEDLEENLTVYKCLGQLYAADNVVVGSLHLQTSAHAGHRISIPALTQILLNSRLIRSFTRVKSMMLFCNF